MTQRSRPEVCPLVLRCLECDYEESVLWDPAFPAPNTVLLELGSRGENLEQEIPAVLDMLVAPSRVRRVRGWHALASAFPERAKLITDYRIDDEPDECQRKIEKLRNA